MHFTIASPKSNRSLKNSGWKTTFLLILPLRSFIFGRGVRVDDFVAYRFFLQPFRFTWTKIRTCVKSQNFTNRILEIYFWIFVEMVFTNPMKQIRRIQITAITKIKKATCSFRPSGAKPWSTWPIVGYVFPLGSNLLLMTLKLLEKSLRPT